MTERDADTLAGIIHAHDRLTPLGFDGVAPIDFGGSNGSHHSQTAAKLVRLGFVETRKRGFKWGEKAARWFRGSNVYRPTDAGRRALADWMVRP